MSAAAGVRAAVVALLELEGHARAAAVVEAGEIEIGPGERWSMGAREVTAYRAALVVAAAGHVWLRGDVSAWSAVKTACAAALHTQETELGELLLVLRLPGLGQGFHHAYRDAPRALPDRPSPRAVLAGAAELLEAEGDATGAALLARASLESAPTASNAHLVRYVVRLDAEDLVAARRDGARQTRLLAAVRAAATRADALVASVDLALALAEPASGGDDGADRVGDLRARITADLAQAPATLRSLRAAVWRGYLMALRERHELDVEEVDELARSLPPLPEGASPDAPKA